MRSESTTPPGKTPATNVRNEPDILTLSEWFSSYSWIGEDFLTKVTTDLFRFWSLLLLQIPYFMKARTPWLLERSLYSRAVELLWELEQIFYLSPTITPNSYHEGLRCRATYIKWLLNNAQALLSPWLTLGLIKQTHISSISRQKQHISVSSVFMPGLRGL